MVTSKKGYYVTQDIVIKNYCDNIWECDWARHKFDTFKTIMVEKTFGDVKVSPVECYMKDNDIYTAYRITILTDDNRRHLRMAKSRLKSIVKEINRWNTGKARKSEYKRWKWKNGLGALACYCNTVRKTRWQKAYKLGLIPNPISDPVPTAN